MMTNEKWLETDWINKSTEEKADVLKTGCPPKMQGDCPDIGCHECWVNWLNLERIEE